MRDLFFIFNFSLYPYYSSFSKTCHENLPILKILILSPQNPLTSVISEITPFIFILFLFLFYLHTYILRIYTECKTFILFRKSIWRYKSLKYFFISSSCKRALAVIISTYFSTSNASAINNISSSHSQGMIQTLF